MLDLDLYRKLALKQKAAGEPTDGCTLVGPLVHRYWPDARSACEAHDYATRDLIEGVEPGSDADFIFREDVRDKGYPVLAWIMYAGVRFRSWTGIAPNVFYGGVLALIAMIIVTSLLLWAQPAQAAGTPQQTAQSSLDQIVDVYLPLLLDPNLVFSLLVTWAIVGTMKQHRLTKKEKRKDRRTRFTRYYAMIVGFTVTLFFEWGHPEMYKLAIIVGILNPYAYKIVMAIIGAFFPKIESALSNDNKQ